MKQFAALQPRIQNGCLYRLNNAKIDVTLLFNRTEQISNQMQSEETSQSTVNIKTPYSSCAPFSSCAPLTLSCL